MTTHREVRPQPFGPARCTGCHWESQPNGINSHDQFLTHLAKVTAGQEGQS